MTAMPGMRVLPAPPGAAVVECTGEHDIVTAPELDAVLEELAAENELVVVDISETEFIDSLNHSLSRQSAPPKPRPADGVQASVRFSSRCRQELSSSAACSRSSTSQRPEKRRSPERWRPDDGDLRLPRVRCCRRLFAYPQPLNRHPQPLSRRWRSCSDIRPGRARLSTRPGSRQALRRRTGAV